MVIDEWTTLNQAVELAGLVDLVEMAGMGRIGSGRGQA